MAERLDRWWRVIATGFCFAIFGVGGLLVWCVALPIFILCVRHPGRRVSLVRITIHQCFRWFVALMARLGILTYEVRDLKRLQRSGLLILANHPSLIDVVFLISFIPNADCIVKAGLLRNPFTRGAISAAGFIANDSAEQLIDDCIRSLRSGNNLIIFPEGTRTPLRGPVRLQRGAANVAIRGNVDITPVRIQSSHPMLTKGCPWYRVPLRRPHFTIEVGEDISVSGYVHVDGKEALAVRQLTEHLSKQLLGERFRAVT